MNDGVAEDVVRTNQAPLARARRPRSSRWRPVQLVGVLIALITAAGAFWWTLHRATPVRYTTAPVTRGAVVRSLTATGTVNPVLTIIVGSYVSGVIQQLFCDYNTVVKAGQVCAKIDPRPFQAALDQYTGQLLRDEGILAEAQRDLKRYQTLEAQNSIARQQAEDQAYVVQQDQGTVKLDEGLVEGAKLNLEYTDITSPVDGTVVSRNVTQGQTVASTLQTPTLFLIGTDLKKMEVDTNVSESDVGGLKEGDQATFNVDAYPNRVFHGTVQQLRLSPQTVQNVVTYDAVIYVDNSDTALMPGMTASTEIVIDQRKGVVRVPDQALRYAPGGLARTANTPSSGGNARLWVLRDGRAVAVSVKTGLDDGNFSEIVEGNIIPGDQVIVGESGGQMADPRALTQPRL